MAKIVRGELWLEVEVGLIGRQKTVHSVVSRSPPCHADGPIGGGMNDGNTLPLR